MPPASLTPAVGVAPSPVQQRSESNSKAVSSAQPGAVGPVGDLTDDVVLKPAVDLDPDCPICHTDTAGQATVSFPCGHKECVSCLQLMLAHMPKKLHELGCPLCRALTGVTRGPGTTAAVAAAVARASKYQNAEGDYYIKAIVGDDIDADGERWYHIEYYDPDVADESVRQYFFGDGSKMLLADYEKRRKRKLAKAKKKANRQVKRRKTGCSIIGRAVARLVGGDHGEIGSATSVNQQGLLTVAWGGTPEPGQYTADQLTFMARLFPVKTLLTYPPEWARAEGVETCGGAVTSYDIWDDGQEVWSIKWADAYNDSDQDQFGAADMLMLWNSGNIPSVML